VVERTERELIMRTLERTRWNRAQTARILGINYKTLQGKLRQYGLPERKANATEP
jgi:two-component system response regulator HydG